MHRPSPDPRPASGLLHQGGVALRATLVFTVLTGLVYPLVVTGLASTLFPEASAGSFARDERGRVIGSVLIGQRFTRPAYFHGRPSAAGSDGYDANASGGSNFGPTSAKLRARALAERDRLVAENPEAVRDLGPPPLELLAASASGLDPHVSPAAARWQIARVARARKVAPERIAAIVERHVEGRDLWVLGEPRVNVLRLNLALDRQLGRADDPPR